MATQCQNTNCEAEVNSTNLTVQPVLFIHYSELQISEVPFLNMDFHNDLLNSQHHAKYGE